MTALPDISSHAIARARWRPGEIAFWVLALSCAFLFPSRYLIMTDIVRLALFADTAKLSSAATATSETSVSRIRRLDLFAGKSWDDGMDFISISSCSEPERSGC